MPTKLAASVLSVVSAVTGLGAGQAAPTDAAAAAKPASFFGFRATALDGSPADLGAHRGKVVLVVNVASRCGYTSQYADLERLWQQYKDKGLVVVGFPCNDFGGQEPGSEKEIGEFCRATYGVTFPMMSKIRTKAGDGQSEIYAFLGSATGKLPSWNFGKYLIGRDGVPVAFYGSGVKPMGDELRAAIDAALAKPAPAAAPPAGGAADAPAAPKAP